MNASLKRLLGPIFRVGACAFLTVFVLPVLYLMEPFYKIRFVMMQTQRIGEFAGSMEILLRKWKADGFPARTRFFFCGVEPCNRQLFDMYARQSGCMHESLWATRLLSAWRPVVERTRFLTRRPQFDDELFFWNRVKPVLSFTDSEESRGEKALREMGIPEGSWFICFHVRDGSYLRAWRPEHGNTWQKTDWKNASLANYLPAADYITSLGGYVVRLGAVVDEPLPKTGNAKIVDYATKHRSDFMDIYLAAKCRFFLGSGSGIDMLASIFGVPSAIANLILYPNGHYLENSLFSVRFVERLEDGKALNYLEVIEDGYLPAMSYDPNDAEVRGVVPNWTWDPEKQKIRWRENAPEDVIDLCRDMIDYLENNPIPDRGQELQAHFAQTFNSHLRNFEFCSKISPRFALRHENLIRPPLVMPKRETQTHR